MVDEDIIERRPYSEKPERYEYFLTEKGLDLWPVMTALMFWGDKHEPLPDGPPVLVIHKGECGGEIDDRRICTKCGKPLTVRETRAVEGPGAQGRTQGRGLAAPLDSPRPMDFELTDEQRLLRDTVRDFARQEVAPVGRGAGPHQELPLRAGGEDGRARPDGDPVPGRSTAAAGPTPSPTPSRSRS